MHFAGGALPAEFPGLFESLGDEPAAQVGIEQDFADSARNIEDIFRIDLDGGISNHFRQGTDAGADHRRPTGHRF